MTFQTFCYKYVETNVYNIKSNYLSSLLLCKNKTDSSLAGSIRQLLRSTMSFIYEKSLSDGALDTVWQDICILILQYSEIFAPPHCSPIRHGTDMYSHNWSITFSLKPLAVTSMPLLCCCSDFAINTKHETINCLTNLKVIE